jgi:hypothetical protein
MFNASTAGYSDLCVLPYGPGIQSVRRHKTVRIVGLTKQCFSPQYAATMARAGIKLRNE